MGEIEKEFIEAIKWLCAKGVKGISDAVRAATGLPAFDAITCCDYFIRGVIDNPRFGINDWQAQWDGEQEEYKLGQHLDAGDLAKMKTVHAPKEKPLVKPKPKAAGKKAVEPKPHTDGKDHPSLG